MRRAFAGKCGPAAPAPSAASNSRTMPGRSIEPAVIERRNWRRGWSTVFIRAPMQEFPKALDWQ